MTAVTSKRLFRLEAAMKNSELPILEDFLFALERKECPPPDYTDTQRRRDEQLFSRWDEFLEHARSLARVRGL
jgi:hypothetical protein